MLAMENGFANLTLERKEVGGRIQYIMLALGIFTPSRGKALSTT